MTEIHYLFIFIQLIKELRNEEGKLSRRIKRLNFGQFIFLYFMARNTSYFVSENIMRALKHAEFGAWNKLKTEKALLSKQNEKEDTPSETSERLPPYRSPNKGRKLYGNKNDRENIEMSLYPTASEIPLPEEVGSSLKTRRSSSPHQSPRGPRNRNSKI